MKNYLIIIANLLLIGIAYGQCEPLLTYEQSSFANETASNNAFTGDTNTTLNSGWEAINTPDIVTIGWQGACSNDSSECAEGNLIDVLRQNFPSDTATEDKFISSGYIDFDSSTNVRNNNMLGAHQGEGIKTTIKLVPGEWYLLRFSQLNVRRKRVAQLNNSAKWSVTLDGKHLIGVDSNGDQDIAESIYMPIENDNTFEWRETLIAFQADASKSADEDRNLEFKVRNLSLDNENKPEFINFYFPLPTPFNQTIMNYLLIDNISLIKRGHCENHPTLTGKDNSSFRPQKSIPLPDFPIIEDYVISAWVKEEHAQQVMNYTSKIEVNFAGTSESYAFTPSGAIIDGWQRIEGTFRIPPTATHLNIALVKGVNQQTDALLSEAYFDDIRIFNAEGSMKSFVYDPETQRLMAELDERNYATFYEYDKEGGLVRVKKETEKGIYTIQETRSSTYKITQ